MNAVPFIPPIILVSPVNSVTQSISILVNIVNVGGVSVDQIQQTNNCRIIAQQDFPDEIMNFLDLEKRDITHLVTAYESKRDATECITFRLTTTRRLQGLLH